MATFVFSGRTYDPSARTMRFKYETRFPDRDTLSFEEKVEWPESFSPQRLEPVLLERMLDTLHLMLGISYFKLFCPESIEIPYELTPEQVVFWNTVYRKGLGEFAFRNDVDLRGVSFPVRASLSPGPYDVMCADEALVGIGGGKDSIVAIELLREESIPSTGFVVETYARHDIAEAVCAAAQIPLEHIVRTLDPQLFQPLEGSRQGHIPISAIYAFLGYFAALASGKAYVVTGNEWSSNFGNAVHHGEEVNHQWSKSIEFEQLFVSYTSRYLSPSVRYFSIVRPLHEIRIAKCFARHDRYFDVCTSCNRKFRIDHTGRPRGMWCGECPKCAFVFLILAPFIPRTRLVGMFGKNLLDDRGLVPLYADILGFGNIKPFDCVGTFDEARAALYLVRDTYGDSASVREFVGRVVDGDSLVESVMHTAHADSVPQRFRFCGMDDVLVLGYGKEGHVSEKFIQKHYPKVHCSHADQSDNPAYLDVQRSADLVVKTAGIPYRNVSAHYTTATNIFFSRWKGKTIGITGSKGKSTTASLVYAMLVAAGRDARLVGNIGNPMLALLEEPHTDETIAVVELSSYQLDDIEYSPDIAAVTALFPEHLDYHGSLDRYMEAKRRITRFQTSRDSFVYDPQDSRQAAWARDTRATGVPMAPYALGPGDTTLAGEHNAHNIRIAATVARLCGVSDSDIAAAIRAFVPLPHRLQYVGTYHDIRFYDDAISTTPESTIAALRSIRDVDTIFLGGHDRGYDFSELEREVRKTGVRNVVLFPDTGSRMLADHSGLNILETTNMEEAVAFAYTHTAPGKVCLLSCASPSYGLWKNFEEKGDSFQVAVRAQASN